MERNLDPDGDWLFRAWESLYDWWYFRPAQLSLSNAAVHYIDSLATLIWDSTRVLTDNAEDPVEAVLAEEIFGATVVACEFASSPAYKFRCPAIGCLQKSKQFVLARFSREADADHACQFQVFQVHENNVIARCQARKPPSNILEGSWVLCVVDADWQHA